MEVITVFNKYFERIDVLSKYTFMQYVDKFNGVGEFKINAILCDENLYLFDENKVFFVAFDRTTMGRIDKVVKDSDSEFERTIEITGRMIKYKLQTSVVYKQQIYSGRTAEVVKQLVQNNMCVGSVGSKRYINFEFNIPSDRLSEMTQINNGQWTGGSVYDAVQPLLQQDNMGFEILPVITERYEIAANAPITNIQKWYFDILLGEDRTRNNQRGNKPIVFSHSLSNLTRSTYEKDMKDYCNVAYVAGEGEGNDRTWIEVYQDGIKGTDDEWNAVGWLRDELFVDARDLQKTADNKTYTDAEYKEMLIQRGDEYLKEHIVFVSYNSTATNENEKYKYGRDFYNGDFVTIVDNELGITVDAQITEVTKSREGSREILDITFGYRSIQMNEKLRRKGVI
jgi:hypothetical protein|nr:MAG TPA: hypothetical protein [Caudoviricetes sp.]